MNTAFESNHIYIIPPSHNLFFKNNRLVLEKTPPFVHTPTPSIDLLFTSLAQYKQQNTIGIVLTGTGIDGTVGLQKIKEYGGITLAQLPQEAEHKGMPQNAIDALAVDFVFSLEDIAHYLSHPSFMQEHAASSTAAPIKTIMQLLHKHENLDIGKYKKETISRRIEKRMLMVKAQTLEEYLDYMQANQKELHTLHQNILIGVTAFFRNKEAFEALEKKLFLYLQDKPKNYELRIWSVACSTGEEAYSLAILIAKISVILKKTFDVHIFATDIDDKALDVARKAFYPKEALKDVDKNLIATYFNETKGGYKVASSLRSQIVFTNHNILSHPPFINQDLITCRNFLIYILPEAQQEIFRLFHYSLRENGLLFLGSSESTMNSVKYFTQLDSENKIYKKENLTNLPKISSHYFSQHTKEESIPRAPKSSPKETQNMQELLQSTIFDFFAPNCVLVDKNFSIVYKQGNLPCLKMQDGFVSLSILENLDATLRYDIGTLLKKCSKTQETQSTKFIETVLPSGEKTFLKVRAHPLQKTQESFMILLYFQELSGEDLQFNESNLFLPNESFVIESLTKQLSATKEELYALSDELMVTKENTQLLSEELQSSNEELQSSNEELETSNEELQSSNEELHASILDMQQLQDRLSLILNSSDDGIFGLDIEGRHTFANAATCKMLGFSQNELIGKNGHELWHHTDREGHFVPREQCPLHSNLNKNLSTRKKELLWRKDGSSFEAEVLQNPILKNGHVIGSVLTFRDMTQINTLTKRAQNEHELFELYMKTEGIIVMNLDTQGNVNMINKQGCALLGYAQKDILGKNWFDSFLPQEEKEQVKKFFYAIVHKETTPIVLYKNNLVDAQNTKHLISWTNSYLEDEQGNIIGLITSGIDITNEAFLSQKLFAQEHLYKLTFEEAEIGIAHASLKGKWIDTNEYLSRLLGYTKKEFKNISIKELTHPEDRGNDKKLLQELLKDKRKSYHREKRYIHKNGNTVWASLNVVLLKDEFNQPLYLLKIIRDITQTKLLMYQIEVEKNELNRIIALMPIPTIIHNAEDEILLLNQAWEQNTGYSFGEITTMKQLIKQLYKGYTLTQQKIFQEDYKESKESISREHTIITKFGERHVWQLKSVLLLGQTQAKETYITSIIDITEIQNKEDLMISQSRQAAMGDMLAMIAHQWRQPLSVISMVSNTLRAQQELEEEITQAQLTQSLQTISEQTNYLSSTIDDFRNFFKPDKKKETIKLSLIFERVATLIAKSLQSHMIALEFSNYKDIELSTYPNQLIQILLNLINNAKDAILEHKPENGRIVIEVKNQKNELTLCVCDNGGGIDPSIAETISQPYVSTKSKNGTGLGLYMSAVIARKNLDAKLSWSSDTQGSSFCVALSKKEVLS
jgi:two-component system CheB/CheR fusion protein